MRPKRKNIKGKSTKGIDSSVQESNSNGNTDDSDIQNDKRTKKSHDPSDSSPQRGTKRGMKDDKLPGKKSKTSDEIEEKDATAEQDENPVSDDATQVSKKRGRGTSSKRTMALQNDEMNNEEDSAKDEEENRNEEEEDETTNEQLKGRNRRRSKKPASKEQAKSLVNNKTKPSEDSNNSERPKRGQKRSGGKITAGSKKGKKAVSKEEQENLNVGDEEDEVGGNEETGTSRSRKPLLRPKQIEISKPQGHQKSPKKGASSVSKTSQKKQSASKTNKNKKDGIYEVEKILTMRKKKGKREFLVRWKGYTDADDTWEPENNLSCDSLLAKFLAESA